MRKIINGKRYDTDTATEVAQWEGGYRGDFGHFTETLYRKRGGEYFIHGVGGPASRYAEAVGLNTWTEGQRIMPLSYDEAREWAEKHLEVDEYEAEFGEVPEDEDGTEVLSVRVPVAAKAALDRCAARTGRPKGDIVGELLMKLR